MKTKLKDRVAIISENNFRELLNLYGELSVKRISEIVNNHIKVAIEEIKEDLKMSNKVLSCDGCEFLKCFDYAYKNYYCDHEDRTNDLGRLGVDNPPEKSPKWCPKSKEE